MVTPTSLPTNIVVGSVGRISHTNILHGAVNDLTDADTGVIRVTEAPLAPERYGAVGDGTTLDDAAFAAMAAVANGSTGNPEIMLGERSYKLSSAINITRSGWTLRGRSRLTSRLINAVSDIFTFAAGSAGSKHLFEDFRASASAGHIFNVTNAAFYQNEMSRLVLDAQSASFSVFNQTSGDFLDNRMTMLDMWGTTGHTVPLWKVLSATGGCNENTFERGRSTYSGNYVFWLEETNAGQYSNSNTFREWNFEVPNGGCIKGLSANGWEIRGCNVYDLAGFNSGVTTKDLFHIGKSTGPASRFNELRQVIRHGGTLGASLVDIMLQGSASAPLTRIVQCDTSTGSGYKIDLGNNNAVEIYGSSGGVTFSNRGVQTFQDNGTNVGWFGATPAVKQTVGAAATDAATTQALVNQIRTALVNYGLA